ncbi:LysR family transcriptional regulator [Paenibacillus sp. VCA1]|uniref:LysR family transcriptional regulator n=1 Tax=Paenibacillus sp. VCA1 TaxID=3039148 RepID=UPI002870EF4F|nr:LysR family transcriptional regulator [Paenibacillus sp. VCA1]MDR9857034.1 LysR family transcriptional regulator [Paenibacillus sp. VCA1]
MDLKSVKTFHRIVALGGFNRAAEELNYAQSTVTMQIQKLEAELGMRLIERGKTFELTEAGRLFLEQSAPIVRDIEQLQDTMTGLALGETGHVRLGAVEPIASYRLPDILAGFFRDYPQIHVSVTIANSPTLCGQLQHGELDLAVCSPPLFGAELHFEPVLTERFVVLLPESHPLTSKDAIAIRDLRDHRLLITSADCPYRRKLEMLMQESGGHPPDTVEIGSMSALKYFVQSGIGAALVPLSVLCPEPDGTVVRPLQGDEVDLTCGLVCKAAEYPPRLAAGKLYGRLKEGLAWSTAAPAVGAQP